MNLRVIRPLNCSLSSISLKSLSKSLAGIRRLPVSREQTEPIPVDFPTNIRGVQLLGRALSARARLCQSKPEERSSPLIDEL